MDMNEKRLIEGLFTRLDQAERTALPRDGEAEGFIRDAVSRQPGAPYYMAQTIIVQEQALEAAQARIQELEARASQQPAGGGGLLGSLFGGGASRQQPAQRMASVPPTGRQTGRGMPAGSPWNSGGNPVPSRGGGFLAGAAQTAVGVAGGMMLGSMLGGLLGGADEAVAGGLEEAGEAVGIDPEAAGDLGGMDDAGFGDFDDI